MNFGIAGWVLIAVVVVMGLVFWMRGRRLGAQVPVRGLAGGFPRTRGRGYEMGDVEEALDRAYGLAASEEGRARALELLHEAQFSVARRGGYDSAVVDLHVDAMIVALQTGRELPVRPGAAAA